MVKKPSSISKFLAYALLTLLLLQGQLLLWGQEQKPSEPHVPEQSLLLWAQRVATGLILLTILLILYTAFFRRPPFPDANAKWLLIIGLILLPLPLMFLGNVVGMEGAKRLEACNSCHVMHPFVNDLKNPESQTLASKHYRGMNKGRWIPENQCYACHVDYSMVGLVQGKRDGLRHAWKYYTNTYELPIQFRPGVREYNAGICLHCHGDSKIFIDQHLDLTTATPQEIADLKADCIKCHTDPKSTAYRGPIHPPRSERSHE